MIYIPLRCRQHLPLRGTAVSLTIILVVCVYAVLTTAAGISNPLYAVAAVYIPSYLYLAWKWPQTAVMLIFAAAPMANEVSGGTGPKISVAEINFILALPVFYLHLLARRKIPVVGPLLWPALLYLTICLYATQTSIGDRAALLSLGQMLFYMTLLVTLFASFVEQPQQLIAALYGLVFVGAVLGAVALAMHTEYILGLHKNSLGGSLACALIVAVELWMAAEHSLCKWLLGGAMALIGGGLLMSLSRGGWLGAAAGLSMIFLLRRDFRLLLRTGLLLTPIIVVLWLSLPHASQEYITNFEAKGKNNIQIRLNDYAMAWRCFESSPIIGIGVQLRKQSDATNVVLFTLAETGVLGLGAFGLLYGSILPRSMAHAINSSARRSPLFTLCSRQRLAGRPPSAWNGRSLLGTRTDVYGLGRFRNVRGCFGCSASTSLFTIPHERLS